MMLVIVIFIIIRDGSITVHEFLALCEEHGAHISEEDLEAFNKRADDNGEVEDIGHINLHFIIMSLLDNKRGFHRTDKKLKSC